MEVKAQDIGKSFVLVYINRQVSYNTTLYITCLLRGAECFLSS